ncbi:regulatory protein RecX [Microbacterium sp. A94]|uniref:regulatory protein RecX n=1 Tax=Microbacterium sp. A94 TaxID=3450717 RepID=UPI003F42ED0F
MADGNGGESDLAPVIPLFGGKLVPASSLPVRRAHAEGGSETHIDDERDKNDDREHDEARSAAEEALVRKLRARSLSLSEARQILRGNELNSAQIDDVIDDFCRRGYLDDAALAEQLVASGIERKGQGRIALSRSLAQRGLRRDVIDAALGELPDDDAERALEFARTKARSLSRLDFETALRRLVGQLARRGYGGSVAMTAARTALTEASLGTRSSGVRFVDSE